MPVAWLNKTNNGPQLNWSPHFAHHQVKGYLFIHRVDKAGIRVDYLWTWGCLQDKGR